MGNVRFIVGRSGSGKTALCIDRFVRALNDYKRPDGRSDAFLIVPEQFAVNYERKVLEHPDCRGMLGSEVISFNRLAHRITSDVKFDGKEPVSASGKAMLLAETVRRLDSRGALNYYKRCAENPGSIAGLLETFTEFSKYCVTPEMLLQAAEKTRGNDSSETKFNELGIIFSEYDKAISEKFIDSSYYIKKAAKTVAEGGGDFYNKRLWVDGFSGFTEEELLFLDAAAKHCREVTVCLFYSGDNEIIFNCPNKTYYQLYRRFSACGHDVETLDLNEISSGSRFCGASALKHLEANFGRIGGAVYGGDVNGEIKIFSCSDSYQEIQNCAAQILTLIKSGVKLSEIAVISSEPESNAAIFRAVFANARIPLFIDVKRDLSGHPVVRFLLAFLDIIEEEMTRENVFSMLKTGLYRSEIYDVNAVAVLENNALACGVRSSRQWKRMCDKLNKKYESVSVKPPFLRLAEDLYEFIYGADGFCGKAKGCRTVGDVCDLLFMLAEKAELTESVEAFAERLKQGANDDTAESYVRIWNVFAEVAGEARRIAGDISVNGYKKLFGFTGDLLRAGLNVHRVGFIPYTEECIQIGNIERSRYLDKKAVFIVGAAEGLFPKPFKENGVLCDKERELLKECGASLAYNSSERTLFAQFNIYSALSLASKHLYISYSNLDVDGRAMFAAPAVVSLKRLFPAVETVSVEPEEYEASAEYVNSVDVTVDRELAARLLNIGAETKMSVSALEVYKKCPYRYFLNYALRLDERADGDVKPFNIGSYFHGIVELASKNKACGEANGNIYEAVKSAVEAFLSEPDNEELKYLFESSARNMFLKDRVDDFAAEDIGNIFALSEQTGFQPIETELEFGMTENSPAGPLRVPCDESELLLRGIIDRVDVRNGENGPDYCIVDYKSSLKEILTSGSVEEGTKLQLMVYYAAASEIYKKAPAAVLYYIYGKNVRTDYLHEFNGLSEEGVFGGELSKVKSADLSELKNAAFRNIKELFSGICGGKFNASPLKKPTDACAYCQGANLCRYKTFLVDDSGEM